MKEVNKLKQIVREGSVRDVLLDEIPNDEEIAQRVEKSQKDSEEAKMAEDLRLTEDNYGGTTLEGDFKGYVVYSDEFDNLFLTPRDAVEEGWKYMVNVMMDENDMYVFDWAVKHQPADEVKRDFESWLQDNDGDKKYESVVGRKALIIDGEYEGSEVTILEFKIGVVEGLEELDGVEKGKGVAIVVLDSGKILPPQPIEYIKHRGESKELDENETDLMDTLSPDVRKRLEVYLNRLEDQLWRSEGLKYINGGFASAELVEILGDDKVLVKMVYGVQSDADGRLDSLMATVDLNRMKVLSWADVE